MPFFGLFKRQDKLLTLAFCVLMLVSLVGLASVSQDLFRSQALWFGISIVIIGLFLYIDFRPIINYRWMLFLIYFVTLCLLIAALFSPAIRNIHAWIIIGPMRFQPAELAKIALIILLSYFFARRHIGIAHVSNLAISFLYVLLPAGLIIAQPDWGSALVVFSIWGGFLLASGIRWRHIVIGFSILLVLSFFAWHFALADYQKERIVGFFQPSYDPLGVNYSVIQAKIAIGSSGWFGKGFGHGTQTQLGFLTEPGTDFIFAAFVEEWGFVGAIILIGAFILLVLRIIIIGLGSRDAFSQFLCLGTASLFLAEFALNVGSNLALVPVIGVTLPFVSYGGSSLLTKAILIGIIQSIAARERF
ncbi:MAG: FtsW/RodA/SpoVE family cell cycle protein [Patescibacteria group bacterium]